MKAELSPNLNVSLRHSRSKEGYRNNPANLNAGVMEITGNRIVMMVTKAIVMAAGFNNNIGI
jgi:hypothetical protein